MSLISASKEAYLLMRKLKECGLLSLQQENVWLFMRKVLSIEWRNLQENQPTQRRKPKPLIRFSIIILMQTVFKNTESNGKRQTYTFGLHCTELEHIKMMEIIFQN